MNPNVQNPVILTEEDFNLLKPYFNKPADKPDEMSLASELSRAIIVQEDAFPTHCIRINSSVSIMDTETKKIMSFMLVMPQHANIKENKVSILSPMGAALIGFRKSEEVEWRVPAGLKRFKIMEVTNSPV